MPLIVSTPYKQPVIQLAVTTTFNPADKSANATLSNNNLTFAGSGAAGARSTVSKSTGKWYWEGKIDILGPSSALCFGLALPGTALIGGYNTNVPHHLWYLYGSQFFASRMFSNGTNTAFGPRGNVGDVLGVALDLDNLRARFYQNGTLIGERILVAGTYFAYSADGGSGQLNQLTMNFGALPFVHPVPVGFNPGLY